MDKHDKQVWRDYKDGKIDTLSPIKCPHCKGAAINTGDKTINDKWGEVVYFKCNNPQCERYQREFNIEVKTGTM